MRQTARFVISTAAVYAITVGVLGYALYPAPTFRAEIIAANNVPVITPTQDQSIDLITGVPVRITVPDYGIDLPVDPGYYNETDGSWTLTPDHAQYATMTYPANNISGNTLIYGHGTDRVFGKLGARTPPAGTLAELYTDNGHVFTYTFVRSRDLTPNDTSILTDNTTPATLTVQTCTGVFSQWRTMFIFQFKEMVQ